MKNEMKMNNKGFSLVELIVVIAIMAILVGVLAPSVLGQIDKAKVAKDKQSVDAIASAVAIAWADQDITSGKPTSTTTDLTITGLTIDPDGKTSEYAGNSNVSEFNSVILNTLGYQQVAFEANAWRKSSVDVEVGINITTGKVTVTVKDGSDELYKVVK